MKDFNIAAYEEIMMEAGLNRIIMSVKQWVSRTNSIIYASEADVHFARTDYKGLEMI